MPVKAIIFDLGGVILDIDYLKTEQAFNALGAMDFGSIYRQSEQKDIFDQFEEGKISDHEFRSSVNKLLNLAIKNDEFDLAWNKMLLTVQKDRLIHITQLLENGYQLFLYSNIDSIHYPDVINILDRDVGIDKFNRLFQKQYLSHLFGHRKPHTESFEKLCTDIQQNFNIQKNELIFIDDTQRHVGGATKAGINSLLVKSNLSSEILFREIASYLQTLRNVNLK